MSKSIQWTLALMSIVFLSSCNNMPVRRDARTPLKSVEAVDIVRYSGLWYNLANYPNSFQQGCARTTAEYRPNGDGTLKVINSCDKPDGPETAEGTARIVPGTNNSQLKVRFFSLAPEGDYWVIYLKDDYSVAAVGEPSGKYLWIIARQPQIPQQEWVNVRASLEAQGYDLSGLEFTKH